MDRISKNTRPHPSITKQIKFGDKESCPIDQQGCKRFNIDPATGRPIDDITAVLKSQGLERERLLAGLTEFKADFLPEDMPDNEALKFYKPRLCQLPSELAEYQEELSRQQLQKAAQDKKLAEQQELFKSIELAEQEKLAKDKEKNGETTK